MISQCEGANFSGAEFVDVIAEKANFNNAIFDNLIAQNSNFKHASCRQAKLRYAQIKDSDFQQTDTLGLNPLKTNFDNTPTHFDINDLLKETNLKLDMQQHALDAHQAKLQEIYRYLAHIQALQEKISQSTEDLQAGQAHGDIKLDKLQDQSGYQNQQIQQINEDLAGIKQIICQHQEDATSNHLEITSLIEPINKTIQLLSEQQTISFAEQTTALSHIAEQIKKTQIDSDQKQSEDFQNQENIREMNGRHHQEIINRFDRLEQSVKHENKTTRDYIGRKLNVLRDKPKLLRKTPENLAQCIIDAINSYDDSLIEQYASQLTSYVSQESIDKIDQQMGCETLNKLITAAFSNQIKWLDRLSSKRILLELGLMYLDQALIDNWPIEFDLAIVQQNAMANSSNNRAKQLADQWAIEYCCDAIKENLKLLQNNHKVVKEAIEILNKVLIGLSKYELWELEGFKRFLEMFSHSNAIITLGYRYLSRHALKDPAVFLYLQTLIQAQCKKAKLDWQIAYAAQQALGYVALYSPYPNLVKAAMQSTVFGLTHFIKCANQKKSIYHKTQWGIGLFEVICKLANKKTSSNASNQWGRFYYQKLSDISIKHRIEQDLIAYLPTQEIKGTQSLVGQYECPYKFPNGEKSLTFAVKAYEPLPVLEETSTTLQTAIKNHDSENIEAAYTHWIQQIQTLNNADQLDHAKTIIETGVKLSYWCKFDKTLKSAWDKFKGEKLCLTIRNGILLESNRIENNIRRTESLFDRMLSLIKHQDQLQVGENYLNYLVDRGSCLLKYYLDAHAFEKADDIAGKLREIIEVLNPVNQCKLLQDLGDTYQEQDTPSIAYSYYIRALENNESINQAPDEKKAFAPSELDLESRLNNICLNAFYHEIINQIPWQLQNKENLTQSLSYLSRITYYRKALLKLDRNKLIKQSKKLDATLRQLVSEQASAFEDSKNLDHATILQILDHWSNHIPFLKIVEKCYEGLLKSSPDLLPEIDEKLLNVREIIADEISLEAIPKCLEMRLHAEKQPCLIDFNLRKEAKYAYKKFETTLSGSKTGDQSIVDAYQSYQSDMLRIIEQASKYVCKYLGIGDYEKIILLFMPTGAYFQVYPQKPWRFALLCEGLGNPEFSAGYIRTVAMLVNILTGETIDTTYQSEIPSPKEQVMGTSQTLRESIAVFLAQNKYREAIELEAAQPCDQSMLTDPLYKAYQINQTTCQSARTIVQALKVNAYRFCPDPQHKWAPVIWLTTYCEALRKFDGEIKPNPDPIKLCQQLAGSDQKKGILASFYAKTLTTALSELLRLIPLESASPDYQNNLKKLLNKLECFLFPSLSYSLSDNLLAQLPNREFNPHALLVEHLLVSIQQGAILKLMELIPLNFKPNMIDPIPRAIHYLVELNHFFANETISLSCYKKLTPINKTLYCEALESIDSQFAEKLAHTLAADGWSYAKVRHQKTWFNQLHEDLIIEEVVDEKAIEEARLYSRNLKDPNNLRKHRYRLKSEILEQLFYDGKNGQFRHKFILRLISGNPNQEQVNQAKEDGEILLIKTVENSFAVGFFNKNNQYQQKQIDQNKNKNLIQRLKNKKFQNQLYIEDDLHTIIYKLVATYHGKLPQGRHTVLFIKIKEEVRYCFKLYPEDPGTELMVSHLLWRLGIAQTVVPLHLVKICHTIIDENGQPKAITSAVLVMQHAAFDAQAKKLIEHENLDVFKNQYKDWDLRVDPISYTQHLLRVILTDPEDGKEDDYLILPSENGKYRLVRIDNERLFFPMYNEIENFFSRHKFKKSELVIKSIIYLMAQIKESLEPSVINPLADILDINQLMMAWLDDVESEHKQLKNLFSLNEVFQHYEVKFPAPVKQRHFPDHLQDPRCTLVIGMYDGIEINLSDRLSLAQGVVDFSQSADLGKVAAIKFFYGTHPRLSEAYYPEILDKIKAQESFTQTLCDEKIDHDVSWQRVDTKMRKLYKQGKHEARQSLHTSKIANQLKWRRTKDLNRAELQEIYQGKLLSVYQAKHNIAEKGRQKLNEIFNKMLEGNPKGQEEFNHLSLINKIYIFEQVVEALKERPYSYSDEVISKFLDERLTNFLKAITNAKGGVAFQKLDLSPFRRVLTKDLFQQIIKGAGSYLLHLDISRCEQLDGDSVILISTYCTELISLIMHDNFNLVRIPKPFYSKDQLPLSNVKIFEIDGCRMIREINSAKIPFPILNKEWWERQTHDYPYLETINGVPCEAVKKFARNMQSGRLEVNSNDFSHIPWSKWIALLTDTREIAKLYFDTGMLDQESIQAWINIIEINEFINEITINGQLLKSAYYSPLEVSFQNDSFKLTLCVEKNIQLILVVLAKQAKLRALDLRYKYIGLEEIKIFVPVLARMTNLEVLNIALNHVSLEEAQALMPVLVKITNLKELNLELNSISPKAVKTVTSELAKLTNLKLLKLRNNASYLNDAQVVSLVLGGGFTFALALVGSGIIASRLTKLLGPETIQGELSSFESLMKVKLDEVILRYRNLILGGENINGDINPPEFETLTPVFAKLKNLEVLEVAANHVSSEGIEELVSVLAELTNLRELNLELNNNINSETIKIFAPVLAKLQILRKLKLRNQTRIDGVLAEILDLGDNAISSEVLQTLANMLTQLPNLEVLDLAATIGPTGIGFLAPALARLTNLRELNLGYNGSFLAGIRRLARVLVRLTNLRALNLEHNGIGPSGIEILTPAIAKLQNLEVLNIGNNSISPLGAETIAQMVIKLINLTELNLYGNCLSSRGIEKFVPVLAKRPNLTVNLNENHVSARDHASINEIMQRIRQARQINTKEKSQATLPSLASIIIEGENTEALAEVDEKSQQLTLTDSEEKLSSQHTEVLTNSKRNPALITDMKDSERSLFKTTDSKLDTVQSDVSDDPEIKNSENTQLNDSAKSENFQVKQADDLVNIQAYYDEGMILKVIATYIEKQAKLRYYFSETRSIIKHFFKQAQEKTLVEACNSGLLVTESNSLYRCIFNGEQRSLSICFSVRFENQMGQACNQITQNIQIALEQISAWQRKAIENKNSDQLITHHTIIFPYLQSANHWNLGLIDLKLENMAVFSACITAYDPFGSGRVGEIAVCSLETLIRKHFNNAKIKLVNIQKPKIDNKEYSKQQCDSYLCGAIVAENAKGFIDGNSKVFKVVYDNSTNKSRELRAKHLNEVDDPTFTKRQKENCDPDPQGDKLSVKVFDANACLHQFFDRLNEAQKKHYTDLLNWLVDIYQSSWVEQDEKSTSSDFQAIRQNTFIEIITKLEKKYKHDNLSQGEKIFIAKFSPDDKYKHTLFDSIKADPEAGLRHYFRRLCLRDKALLNKIKIQNIEGQSISLFNAFFEDEAGKFCNGGYRLLNELAKEHCLAPVRQQCSQYQANDSYNELKARLITYPAFRVCLPEDPRLLITNNSGLMLIDMNKSNLSRFRQQLWNEFYDKIHGLACYMSELNQHYGVEYLQKVEIKVNVSLGCYMCVVPAELLNILSDAFIKLDTESSSKQQVGAQANQFSKDTPIKNHVKPRCGHHFFGQATSSQTTAQMDQIEDDEWVYIEQDKEEHVKSHRI